MRLAVFAGVVVVLSLLTTGATWAIDESEITATNKTVVESEDAEFNAAMKVWMSHRYQDDPRQTWLAI